MLGRPFVFGTISLAIAIPGRGKFMPDIRETGKLLIGESVPVWDFDTVDRNMQAGKPIKTQLRFA